MTQEQPLVPGGCSGHFSQGLGLILSQAAAEGTDTSVREPWKGSSSARDTQERKYWDFCLFSHDIRKEKFKPSIHGTLGTGLQAEQGPRVAVLISGV